MDALFVFFRGPKDITHFHGFVFGFLATKQRFSVLGFTSNMFANKHSDFLALGFLTGDDVICTLGLLSVTPSGVDSRADSRISLSFFGHHFYLHVDISFWCCSYICVQKKTWWMMIGQYKYSSYDLQDVMIATYI